jgi:hypothetical protein
MAVIFPDIERVLVAGIEEALAARSESYAQDVYVATIKPAPDLVPYPERLVIVQSNGGAELDHVRKQERLGLTIWANTYADANALSRLVEALIKTLTGNYIKQVSIALSPVRVAESGIQECRYMTFEVITKGSEL